jgi:hypothetical protein
LFLFLAGAHAKRFEARKRIPGLRLDIINQYLGKLLVALFRELRDELRNAPNAERLERSTPRQFIVNIVAATYRRLKRNLDRRPSRAEVGGGLSARRSRRGLGEVARAEAVIGAVEERAVAKRKGLPVVSGEERDREPATPVVTLFAVAVVPDVAEFVLPLDGLAGL